MTIKFACRAWHGLEGCITDGYERLYETVDLDAVRANAQALISNVKPGTKAYAVVKADAYGCGDVPVAKALEDLVDGYCVATLPEAVNLRHNGIGTDKAVKLLGYVEPEEYETLIANDIEAVVFDYETAQELSHTAVKMNHEALCQIAVDTGMRRIGMEPTIESARIVSRIAALPRLSICGAFTHFAKADETDKTTAKHQYALFDAFRTEVEKLGVTIPVYNCANSAAVIDLPDFRMDGVRLGIALYGMYPSGEVNRSKVRLKPVISLTSRIAMIKEVPEGTAIGYGGTFVTKRPTKVATVTAGYGDGYPRNLSNKGQVIIDGKKAPIIGRVCMDQFMADVTDIPGAKRHMPVTLIGSQGGAAVSVEETAALAGTFNYEFVCDLGKRIPRVYVRDGAVVARHDWFYTDWNIH